MELYRKVVYYPDVKFSDLDAGVCVAYPLPDGKYKYYGVPSFLIIGAQKCGTTELRNWLHMHPYVRGLRSEGHFFDEVLDLEQEWLRYVLNPFLLLSKEKQHFLCHQHLQTFEKTPAYFHKENRGVLIPALIKKMMPSGRFIVTLRNPSERAYSAYQMGRKPRRARDACQDYIAHDFLTVINQAMSPQISQKSSQKRLITIGHYAEHIENWLNYFSPDQLCVVLLEEFKNNPFEVMEKLMNFLELPHFDYRPLVEKNFRGLWTTRQKYRISSKANDPEYEPMSQLARELLDEYYAPWNQKLKKLMPNLSFNW